MTRQDIAKILRDPTTQMDSKRARTDKPSKQSRKWCFTNFQLEDDGTYDYDIEPFNILKYGLEICPSTGKQHHQGFCVTKKKTTLHGLKEMMKNPSLHCEIMKGKLKHSEVYCSKDEKYVTLVDDGYSDEGGRPSTVDWDLVRQQALKGDFDSIDSQAYVTQYRNIHAIAAEGNRATKLDHPCGIWIWGAPGLGKTTLARTLADGSFYEKDFNKWWCGYNRQKAAILDDADPTNITGMAYLLKQWTDEQPFRPEMKGSNLGLIRPQLVIITSQYNFTDLFNREDSLALSRRMVTYHLTLNEGVIQTRITPRTPSPATLFARSVPTTVGLDEEDV